MTREEFIKKCTLLGLGAYLLPSTLASCKKKEDDWAINFSGSVLVIGAGAAGLTAAYRLRQHNIDVRVIEASSVFGGRVKKLEGFADFPIDLGAEWLHTQPKVFGELINDESATGSVDMIKYNPQTYQTWNNGKLRNQNWVHSFYSEYKFKRSTWYDFFDQYIVPSISDRIVYNSPVASIDYSGAQATVTTTDGTIYTADKIICTVPLTILQQGLIDFTPALPSSKTSALDSVGVPPGIKVFMEFSERFYPDLLIIGGVLNAAAADQPLYYDAAFRKDSDRHIMGLFWVDDAAARLTELPNDDAVIANVLEELDTIFDGKASQHFLKGVVQNWSKEPYIRGSYSVTFDNYSNNVADLIEPLNNTVFFAGEAMIDGASSTVHGAGQSGIAAVKRILEGS